MRSPSLTGRQQQVLDFIVSEVDTKGFPPSVREIGHRFGLSSSSTVHNHLQALEEKNYIRRDGARPRAIEILKKARRTPSEETPAARSLPVLGRIAAGEPILAEQNVEEHMAVPDRFGERESFVLKVKGSSMVEASILDGDYLVVEATSTAADGDIVVALLDDEATVKRFFREKDHVRLQPENVHMEPTVVKDVAIIGRAIAVFREL
ncbi:MAG: transcriptional repressor LexA [Terriglobia bacterium]